MKFNFLLVLSSVITIFLIGCASKEPDINYSTQAKEELRQLLQKAPIIETFDITYNFRINLFEQSVTNITFRQAKQGQNQKQDAFGNMLGFNLSATSIVKDGQQTTCAVFDNEWKCSYGDKVCIEKDEIKQCQSVSNEGIPPTINLKLSANADVADAGAKQLIGIDVKCYILTGAENGRKVSIEVCLNQDGLIFSMSTKAKGFQAIIEAKSFSTNIEPDIFTLPAKIS